MAKDLIIYDVGDHVEKVGGYRWVGVVVAAFHTTDGKAHYVVERTAPDLVGALFIYSDNQLKLAKSGDT